ncbi:cytochrome P450 CYP12A2-like isoform X1 [Danaus plexippus]|uniref:cytochrome P450 CYP12A2-like isoform X1 n=2 Tax=Danaus plexippus TaxID=13037 RepID=UPI002AAF0B14|nr:cytochrome P450 CYP12A2-like isoform X1 [Danaus plexippus]
MGVLFRNLMFKNHRSWSSLRCYSSEVKPFTSVPGLSSLPILGPIHHFLPVIGSVGPRPNFYDLAKVLHEKFGSIVKLDGIFSRSSMLILYDPKDFDQVYRSEEPIPSRPGFDTLNYYRKNLEKSKYEGIHSLTTSEGVHWRDTRTKVNPVLLKPKLVKLYSPLLEEIADEMVQRIKNLDKDARYMQENFDFEITKWSLESVAVIALGARLGCFQNDLPESHPARILIECAKDIINLSWKLEFRPSMWKYLATKNFRKIIRAFDLQWDTSVYFIREAEKKIKERGHDVPEEDKSIIEKLLSIDEKVALAMGNEMLLAGIDTVSFTTIGLLYYLAKYPEVQEKIRKEINSSEPSKRYLKACLKESLRLHAVVPANLRRTTREHVVAGYLIPKGIDVIAPNEYLSKLDEHYPRAKEFIPERWLVEKSDPLYYGNCHPMITLPFGFGVRSCIGRRIAEMEIEILVTKLLKNMKISWNGPPIQVVTRLMNSFRKPFYFKFESIS